MMVIGDGGDDGGEDNGSSNGSDDGDWVTKDEDKRNKEKRK